MKPATRLILRSGALLALLVAACPMALAQSQNRVIEWPKLSTFNSGTATRPGNHYVDRIVEVEIELITVEGQSVTFGTPFPASDEWLKSISFRVKNISTRPIKQVQINLIMPQLGPHNQQQIAYLCRECGVKVNPISLAPGASANLTLPDVIYEWAKGIIKEKNLTLSQINELQLLVCFTTFGDGPTVGSDCMRTLDLKNRCPYRGPQ